jgi:hypothetical protein
MDEWRNVMKKVSAILIILSSVGIVVGGALSIVYSFVNARNIIGLSFIGLGVGAILYGIQLFGTKQN